MRLEDIGPLAHRGNMESGLPVLEQCGPVLVVLVELVRPVLVACLEPRLVAAAEFLEQGIG